MLICRERRALFLTRSPSFREKLVRLFSRFWWAKYNAQFSVIVGVVISWLCPFEIKSTGLSALPGRSIFVGGQIGLLSLSVRFHPQFGMYNAAFTCTTQRRAARLPAQIRAPHKGNFFLDMIEHPVAPFQALHGNFFYLGNCV